MAGLAGPELAYYHRVAGGRDALGEGAARAQQLDGGVRPARDVRLVGRVHADRRDLDHLAEAGLEVTADLVDVGVDRSGVNVRAGGFLGLAGPDVFHRLGAGS